MVEEGREIYADPSSMMKAGVMMLSHIGYMKEAELINSALMECNKSKYGIRFTGRPDGVTNQYYTDCILDIIRKRI